MISLRQCFCRHKFEMTGKQKDTQELLWQCPKCKVYCIQHYGMGLSYKCKKPNIGGWIKINNRQSYNVSQ